MRLNRGDRLGPYEILDPLGSGGMGEVYRARDPRLDREVAIKVLPAALTEDPSALARFEREAKAVAALSHPSILGIFDFSSEGELRYAVMELLIGETLRERLDEGPVPAAKAIEMAAQVADGLAAAHAQGVFHRDLKPENLFLTRDGRVKILDFGLARLEPPGAAGLGNDTQSPTLTRQTDPGTVLGTVGYMSPEQVRGDPADERSDIFSLGVVLHELLTGERAFARDTAVETMTAILREEPQVSHAAASVPADLEPMVRHCLEKEPQQRFQSAGDLAFALRQLRSTGVSTRPPIQAAPSPRPRGLWPWLLAAAAASGGIGLGLSLAPAPPPTPVPKISPITYSGRDWGPAVSPDGRTIAYASDRDGRWRIWLRQLATGSERPITEGFDQNPSFSPDGEFILFTRGTSDSIALYRVPSLGGQARKMVDDSADGAFSPDGRHIASVSSTLVDGARRSRLRLFTSDGGNATDLVEAENVFFYTPHWSPDSRLIAVGEQGVVATQNRILVFDRQGELRHTIEDSSIAGGVSPGLFLTSSSLLVSTSPGLALGQRGEVAAIQLCDLETLERETVLWVNNLQPNILSIPSLMALFPDGRLLFDTAEERQRLLEVELDGIQAGPPRQLTQGMSRDRQPIYSRDGREVIFSSNRSGNLDIWAVDRETRALRQLTDHPSEDWDPGLSADGEELLWSSSRSGNLEIWTADLDGTSSRQLSRDGYDAENPTMTADGEFIIYVSNNPATQGFWRMRADGSEPTRINRSAAVIPEISPDGRWFLFSYANEDPRIQFASVESGDTLPFQVKASPGGQPLSLGILARSLGRARWAPDGRGIFYIGIDSSGNTGILYADFDPGADADATGDPRPVVGFQPGQDVESLGLSVDGRYLAYSVSEVSRRIMIAEDVPLTADPERPFRPRP